jgi:hypothetical protein
VAAVTVTAAGAGSGKESMQRSHDCRHPIAAGGTLQTAFRARALPMYNDRNRPRPPF